MGATQLQSLPTAAVDLRAMSVQIARTMLSLVGVGWQAPQDSLVAADALALGSSYANLREELLHVWDQAFVAFATSDNGLLTEWEQVYGLPVDTTMSDASRQARLGAFARSSISGTPQSIEAAVSAYTGTCTVVESIASEVWATDPLHLAATRRLVFLFVVVVPIGFGTSVPKNAQVRAIVDRMKPAHTNYNVANQVGFFCDDPDSLTDLTVLGE